MNEEPGDVPQRHRRKRHPFEADADFLRQQWMPTTQPSGPTAESYRIVGYADGLIGAKRPECDVLRPHYDSGLKWPDPNNPKPDDPLWGAGVRAGVKWDGTFYRDLNRYSASGEFFWCAYLTPGSAPGIKKGYWFNFGNAWSHLANDDPHQVLAGASQRLFWNPPHAPASRLRGDEAASAAQARPAFAANDSGVSSDSASPRGEAASPAGGEGEWKLVIEATMFVTYAVVPVWVGTKSGGTDPVGAYTRVAGCDPLATVAVESVP